MTPAVERADTVSRKQKERLVSLLASLPLEMLISPLFQELGLILGQTLLLKFGQDLLQELGPIIHDFLWQRVQQGVDYIFPDLT